MTNKWIGLVFGVLITLLGFFGMYNEPNAELFAITFGCLAVGAKELVSVQMFDNVFDKQTFWFGIIGCVLAILIALCF